MKLSYAISVQGTKFESIAHGNLGEMFSMLGGLGFDGVEIDL